MFLLQTVTMFFSFFPLATQKKKPKPVVQVDDEHIKGELTYMYCNSIEACIKHAILILKLATTLYVILVLFSLSDKLSIL